MRIGGNGQPQRSEPLRPLPPQSDASTVARLTLAKDDEEERRVRLLLLGKAAVLAHRYERPLAAEMDEREQSSSGAADGELRCRNAREAAVRGGACAAAEGATARRAALL
jgi:hypothetical protein